jgi:hypothetical protein
VIVWRGTLPTGIRNLDAHIIRRMAVATAGFAPRIEAHMKSTAPWTDQTGNARAGLFARPEISGASASIVFGHSVYYGIFLETRFSGAYAVVLPTLEEMAPQFMSYAARIIFSGGFG